MNIRQRYRLTRRLATANKSRVSFRVTEILASVIVPVIITQNLAAVCSYRAGVCWRSQKFVDAGISPPWKLAWLTPRNTPLLICVIVPNLVVLIKGYERTYGDGPETLGPSRSVFQSYSRSSEPTLINRLSITYSGL